MRIDIPFSVLRSVAVNSDTAFSVFALHSRDSERGNNAGCSFKIYTCYSFHISILFLHIF